MKTIFKGMVLLLAGASFMACSKDVSFDENAVKQAQQEAEIAKMYTKYQSDFVKAFGSIAPNHKWGFDQTSGIKTTRGAYVSTAEPWKLPAAVNSEKEGVDENAIQALLATNYTDKLEGIDFKNVWLQHYGKAHKHNQMGQLQVYDSSGAGWIDVTYFNGGQYNGGGMHFHITSTNEAVWGTTLLADLGGKGDPAQNNKIFRWYENNKWNYNYVFYTNSHGNFLCLPHTTNQGVTYWIIKISQAQKKNVTPVVKEGRIFCEDMGSNDFDFNDVVFDAIFNNTTKEIEIEVLAHGGELAIEIDGHPVTLEAMSNTGLKTVPTQTFTIPSNNGEFKYSEVIDIPVKVYPAGAPAMSYELGAETGKAPQKICVPVGILWPDEFVNIKRVFMNFNDWANHSDPADWCGNNFVKRLADGDMDNNGENWIDPLLAD